MKHYRLYCLSIMAIMLTAVGCYEYGSIEDDNGTDCQAGVDIWKCDTNTLYKCVSEKWELAQACEANTQCNASIGACTQTDTPTTECKDAEHFFADKCEADDLTHCGTHTNDCTAMSGVKNVSCIGKKCFAEDCEVGYHLASVFDSDNKERTICAQDTHEACGSINRQCGVEEICTQGKCKDSCQPGEVVCGGSCINPNTSKNFCGADASCSSYTPCSESENCMNGKCVQSLCPNNVCNQTKVTDEALVCKNDNTHCGTNCLNCNTFTNNATAGICNTNGSCQVTACKSNFHIYNNACEADSTTNCGAHGTKCNVENATNTCSGGKCTFTCLSNFHTYNNACEANNTTNCGKHGNTCTTGQTCNAGNCVSSSINIGDIITFGHYEQDNNTSNGKEPIEWRVLDIDSDGHFLIISDKVLDVQRYNTTDISITWERSTIRSWLNGYGSSYNTVGTSYTSNNFIDTAFTPEERARIIASKVPAHVNPHWSSIPAGNETTDKIFLLSVVEAESYFTTNEARKAYTTPYAAYNYNDVLLSSDYCIMNYYILSKCSVNWWLRSPGSYPNYAAYVRDHGGVDFVMPDGSGIGVRPALWVN
ncbi:MAG: hypothetical protein IJU23_09770 [Proteobacteria bacterium]|nr:hypothetical protein [Pseudomonadota bacterium]